MPASNTTGDLKVTTLLPLAWCLLLFLAPLWGSSFHQRWQEESTLRLRLTERQSTLDQLSATSVAARAEGREYESLLKEFTTLTQLKASDPFRDPQQDLPSSVQVAALVRAVQEASHQDVAPGTPLPITLRSVTPGSNQRFGPFLMTEFELNLEGRFHALPAFLDLLTQVGQRRRLVVSVGSLSLSSRSDTERTGILSIKLPIRAYFRE